MRDAAVLARAGPEAEASLAAYVAFSADASAGRLQGLKQAMERSPASMRPAKYYLVDKIPRLASSKLDVRAPQALDAANLELEVRTVPDERRRASRAGTDPIAATAAQVWR